MADSSEPVGFSPTEQAFFRALKEHNVRFIVVGAAAARLQGAPIVTEDIDLWFAPDSEKQIIEAANAAKIVYLPAGIAMNPPTFGGKGIRLDQVLTLHGLGSFDQETKNTFEVRINGIEVRVLKLERIIESKRATNREKDRAMLPALEAALAALNAKPD